MDPSRRGDTSCSAFNRNNEHRCGGERDPEQGIVLSLALALSVALGVLALQSFLDPTATVPCMVLHTVHRVLLNGLRYCRQGRAPSYEASA